MNVSLKKTFLTTFYHSSQTEVQQKGEEVHLQEEKKMCLSTRLMNDKAFYVINKSNFNRNPALLLKPQGWSLNPPSLSKLHTVTCHSTYMKTH